jgi:hypothetical protein
MGDAGFPQQVAVLGQVDGLPEGAPFTLYFITTYCEALLTATTFQNHTSAKSVSKDTWRQFFDFYRAHPTGFDAYDEDSTLASSLLFAGSRTPPCNLLSR